jgi:hypothetical protein
MQLTEGYFTIQIKCDYQFRSLPFFPDKHTFSQKPFLFSAFFGKISRIFKAIKNFFIHGCFWHMQYCRYGKVKPATHKKFWQDKRLGNVERDKCNIRKLRRYGWKVLVIWECQTRHLQNLSKKLQRFLTS